MYEDNRTHVSTGTGIGLGNVIAAVVSYCSWHSIGWAILHGIFGWIYIIYYAIKYILF